MTTRRRAAAPKPRANAPDAATPAPAAPVVVTPPPGPVAIGRAKGMPRLTWVGKRPLDRVPAYPAQLMEEHRPSGREEQTPAGWPRSVPVGGLLYYGDNKDVLGHLISTGLRGQVKFIYIDPPFDSGADYVRKVDLRGISKEIKGEGQGIAEIVQYSDIWAHDTYLQFMYERLLLLKELLSETGTIAVHMDPSRGHYLKIILDEVFGPDGFLNEIAWCYTSPGRFSKWFPRRHDCIYWYSKAKADLGEHTFNGDNVRIPYKKLETGNTDGIFSGAATLSEEGKIPEDWWSDVTPVARLHATELNGYPTQKPEKLLARLISAATGEGDLILDCFIGSGTTAAVAQRLGRRWIGCDINKGAIQTTAKRLRTIIDEQVAAAQAPQQASLLTEASATPPPAQLGFSLWRVNDYDLQIQHNEALDLACQHLGVQRTKTDRFFEGALGTKLVKIIPFTHPLSPTDLEDIKAELLARPDEERAISVVCLGKELAADAWLAEWNKHRSAQSTHANRIDAIELRTDPKYGGFLIHEPATATVAIARKGEEIRVEVQDVISPSIVKRLEQAAPSLKPRIPDWKAVVDCVLIDTAYDGATFRVVLADIPERKQDYIQASYRLPAPAGPTRIAVKVIDLLGEEILVVKDL